MVWPPLELATDGRNRRDLRNYLRNQSTARPLAGKRNVGGNSMMILLSMAVALAAFFAVMLWLDPVRRKRTVIATAMVAGAAVATNGLPTVGGPAFADEEGEQEQQDAPGENPSWCQWGGNEIPCGDGGVGSGPYGPGYSDYGGGGNGGTRALPSTACNIGIALFTGGIAYGILGLAAPEPALSKLLGAGSLVVGLGGAVMIDRYCEKGLFAP